MAGSDDRRWTGCLTLGPWWLLYTGVFGPTDKHHHHAAQVIVCATPVTVWFESGLVAAEVVVIPTDVAHRIAEGPEQATILFIDGDTLNAGSLAAGAVSLIAPSVPLDPRDVTYDVAVTAALHLLGALGVGSASSAERSVEIARALRLLDDDLAVAATALAAQVGLSASELSRRFTHEVGLPFRSYRKWRRLLLALDAVASGANLTVAAHDAGFADSAHLTRTFRAMFGIAPTDLTSTSRWLTPS